MFLLHCTYGQTTISGYEYWFDNNYNTKIKTVVAPVPQLSVNSNVATSGLEPGIHTVNLRSWDSNYQYSSTLSSFFYKIPEQAIFDRKIATYEYWFDNDFADAVVQNTNNQETFALNINAMPITLPNGIHTFNIRFKDNTGFYSSTLSTFFYKIPEQATFDRKIATYEYWFDNDFANAVVQNANNQETFALNTNAMPSTLPNGIHTFNIRFKDNTGFYSSTLSSFFYKVPEQAIFDRKIATYEYWFDNDFANAVVQNANNQETFALNTNAMPSTLPNGIHTFNIRFKDNTGFYSSTLSSFFYKIPEQATFDRKIATYEYWFDNDFADAVVQNANNQETFALNTNAMPSTLPNGIHTLNIRFKDNTGFYSSTLSNFFYKSQNENTVLKNISAYEYWFNDDYSNVVYKTIEPKQIANIDTFVIPESAGLGIGNHTMNIRFQDDSGLWSSILTSDSFELTALGIEKTTKLENVILYPNPTDRMIQVDLASNYSEVQLRLYDMNGRLIKQQSYQNKESFEFEMKETAGIYLISISAENKEATFRIIKK